jgi:hypothetical protein
MAIDALAPFPGAEYITAQYNASTGKWEAVFRGPASAIGWFEGNPQTKDYAVVVTPPDYYLILPNGESDVINYGVWAGYAKSTIDKMVLDYRAATGKGSTTYTPPGDYTPPNVAPPIAGLPTNDEIGKFLKSYALPLGVVAGLFVVMMRK